MSIHDELIAKTLMAKPETDEEWLNIDWESRLITIPSTLTNIGVYNDKDTNRLYFRCPIEYGEFKIADFGVHVNYQNTGKSNTKYDGDVYFVDDVESDGEYLTFSWLVGRHAYLEQGTTAFIVCCKVVDSDDNVVNELNTTIATLSVLEGLEVDVLPPEDYPDYLEELLRRVEDAEATANEALSKASEIPTKVSQLDNDSGYITDSALDGYAKESDVPTELSELDNDVGYITNDALDGYALEDQIPTKVSELDNDVPYATEDDVQAVADSAITAITVNGESVPVEDNTAEITVGGSGASTKTFSLSGCYFSDWTIHPYTIPVDGAPIGVVEAWTDNSDCFLGEAYIDGGNVIAKGFSDGNKGSVTIYVTVLYA